jgi:hypothetical protein
LAITRITFGDDVLTINSDDAMKELFAPHRIQHDATSAEIVGASNSKRHDHVASTN